MANTPSVPGREVFAAGKDGWQRNHLVYVLKRPHVDEFLQRMGDLYECVLFTASLAKRTESQFLLTLEKSGVGKTSLS
ncbi:UNVERIFIED_CONTAM: hypothetical protein K2H54_010285 [Gekko kuhli]